MKENFISTQDPQPVLTMHYSGKPSGRMCLNPLSCTGPNVPPPPLLHDFTLSNIRRFYSSRGEHWNTMSYVWNRLSIKDRQDTYFSKPNYILAEKWRHRSFSWIFKPQQLWRMSTSWSMMKSKLKESNTKNNYLNYTRTRNNN